MRREARGGLEARRESGPDIADEQFDKSWIGTAANYQAVRMQWLERERTAWPHPAVFQDASTISSYICTYV